MMQPNGRDGAVGGATETPGAAFAEGSVDVEGYRARCWTAGDGDPLIQVHGAAGPRLTRAHELLAQRFRVVLLELPGWGPSPVHEGLGSARDAASFVWGAIDALHLGRTVSLLGSSIGGKVALWMAIQHPDRVAALVLEGPAAIRPLDHDLSKIPPHELPQRAFAHPERLPPLPPVDPEVQAKQRSVVGRWSGPNRDPELERHLAGLHTPTLVLFGVQDGLVPPEMGSVYRRLMPAAHLILVYDAAHAIQVERPEAFAGVVGDFLRRREAFVVSRESSVVAP